MSSQVSSWIQDQRDLETSQRLLQKEVAELRAVIRQLAPSQGSRKPPSSHQIEQAQFQQVLSSLGDRISNPFIFTVALDQVQKAAANTPQNPLSVLAFAVIVLSIEITNARLTRYFKTVKATGSPAWRRSVDLGVYIAGIATNIFTIIFSTLSGAVVSDSFKSLPNGAVTTVLVLVILFLCVFRLAQGAIMAK